MLVSCLARKAHQLYMPDMAISIAATKVSATHVSSRLRCELWSQPCV